MCILACYSFAQIFYVLNHFCSLFSSVAKKRCVKISNHDCNLPVFPFNSEDLSVMNFEILLLDTLTVRTFLCLLYELIIFSLGNILTYHSQISSVSLIYLSLQPVLFLFNLKNLLQHFLVGLQTTNPLRSHLSENVLISEGYFCWI